MINLNITRSIIYATLTQNKNQIKYLNFLILLI